MNHIALSRNDFGTLEPIHIETGLGIVVAVCLILAVALVVLVVWLSKPALKPTKKTNRGRHDASTGTSIWHERINDVVDRHANGDLGREEAFALLASIARDFVSTATGSDVRNQTLTDIEATPRTTGNQHGLTLLRQTIEHCIRRNSRMPNAITRPERPRLNRLESGLPILWKGGDEWNCHGTGRG